MSYFECLYSYDIEDSNIRDLVFLVTRNLISSPLRTVSYHIRDKTLYSTSSSRFP